MKQVGTPWHKTPLLAMKRGPYVSYSVLSETAIAEDQTLLGYYVNLFSGDLKILKDPVLKVGSVGLLYDLSYRDSEPASLIAVSGRSDNIQVEDRSISFTVDGTLGYAGNGIISCSMAPKAVEASVEVEWTYCEVTGTASFTLGAAEGPISIRFIF